MVTLEELGRGAQAMTLANMEAVSGFGKRRETVLALANLQDGSHEIFSKQFQGDYEAEDLKSFTVPAGFRIYQYRDSLRKIWEGDHQATANLVSDWVKQANKRAPYRTEVHTNTREQTVFVLPNYSILPLSLALGVSNLWPKMAVCGNPKCPNRYFLKGRRTQRFCDRPACAAYGQREHKRIWWNKYGVEWKQKWGRKAESRHKRTRKKGKKP
jgi:hypothetical protein